MSRRFHLCRDGEPLPAALQGAVVAIGNFDGVHRGHQRLIALAREVASRNGRPNAVLTFDPHPRLFFNPDAPLFSSRRARSRSRCCAGSISTAS